MTWEIKTGGALEILKQMPDQSISCCVTSPPYFGLRDYKVDGQMGLESTPEEYVTAMGDLFDQVRRVLKDHGTLWINLGDSYNSRAGGYWPCGDFERPSRSESRGARQKRDIKGLKQKDLIGIPWMLAFELRRRGWYLRSEIIWSKPNPMPESVTDRPTKAHETIFLLSKGPRYFYDAEAIKEPAVTDDNRRPYGSQGAWELDGRPAGQRHGGQQRESVARGGFEAKEGTPVGGEPFRAVTTTRNKRSVWEISTRPFSEAHFATFPPELPLLCIRAGTSERGECGRCGAPWTRIIKQEKQPRGDSFGKKDIGKFDHGQAGTPFQQIVGTQTVGWCATCLCADSPVTAATVLDPFSGAGTTGMVALKQGRSYIGIELNPDYVAMSKRRIEREVGLLF